VNVIEHIQDDHALVARLSALLKPGGRLVVYVPACPIAFGSLDRALGHFRRYTPATLAALMGAAGLQPEWPRYMNVLGLLGWLVNGRLLRRERLSPTQVAFFEKIIWLARLLDRLRLPFGLGVYARGVRPS
jgi:SAM-dependent methyltransferase